MVYRIEVKPLPPERDGTLRVLWDVWETLEDPTARTGSKEKLTTGIVSNWPSEPFYTQELGPDPNGFATWVSDRGEAHWSPKPLAEQYDILVLDAQEDAETFVDTLLAHSVVYEYPRLEQVIEPVFNTN